MNVRKTLCLFLAMFVVMSFLCGCTETNEFAPSDPIITEPGIAETYDRISFTRLGYVKDSDGIVGTWILIVDNTTKIVYLQTSGRYDSVTPYLAPNGRPYTYDKDLSAIVPLPAYEGEIIPDEWIIPVE